MQSGGGPLQSGPPVMRGLASGTPTSQQQPDMQKMQSQPPLMNQQYQQQNMFRSAGTNQATRPTRPIMSTFHGPIYAPVFQVPYNTRIPSQWANYGSMPGMSYPHQFYVQQHIISGQHQQNRRNPAGENNLVNVNSNYSAAPSNGGTNLNPLTPIPQMPQVQLAQPQPNQSSMAVSHDLLVMQQMHQAQPQQTPQQVTGAGQTSIDQHQPNSAQVNVGTPQPPHAMMQQLQLAPHLAAGNTAPPAKVNKKKQRGSRAIPIIHPDTKEDVLDKIYNDSTPAASTSVSSSTTAPPQSIATAPSYSTIPPNVPQIPLNAAVESDYDNYTPHPHQGTPELAGPAGMGLLHHQPPPHLHHPPPPPNHPPPHVHPAHPAGVGAHPAAGQGPMLISHDMGRPQSVNSQTHEMIYPGAVGPIKIVNPPPHLPHHSVTAVAAAEMTAGGTPVVSAIVDAPSVEIKPFQKKKKPTSEIIIQQPPPLQQPQHSIEMHPSKSLPPNSSQQQQQQQQQHLQHNACIGMNESVQIPCAGPVRYRTISEKSIAESTLSTDAEPFVYTGPSSCTIQQPIPPRVEEIPQPANIVPEVVVPFVPLMAATVVVEQQQQQQHQFSQETVPLKREVDDSPPMAKSSNKIIDTLITSVEKLSVEDNNSSNNNNASSNQTGPSNNSRKQKQNKKRIDDTIASETSKNIGSSMASASIVEQQPMVAAVDETDRSVVSTETPQHLEKQQSSSSSSLISNLVEHNTNKLDNDNIINNNNVDCTSTTTDNTTEQNNTSSPMENDTQQQQSLDSRQHTPEKLDIENNVPHAEFDDNKNVVGVESTPEVVTKPDLPPLKDSTTTNESSVVATAAATDVGNAKLNPAVPAKKSRSITLIEYDPDQWSPDNPSGKKKYSRDQLMQLKNTATAREKPANLPNSLENVLIRSSHGGNHSMGGGGQYGKTNYAEISLLPTFMKDRMVGGGGNMGQMRQPYTTKRSSQQGNSGQSGPQSNKQSQQGMSKTGSKIIRLQLDEEVKLNECANAWRPRHLQTSENLEETERVTQELYKKFRSILNKLTPENFDKLVQQVKSYVIDTDERLSGCIRLVFEKAISEPNFSEAYAKMCKEIGTIAIQENKEKRMSFKGCLLSQCQHEFEKRRNDQTSASRELRVRLEANKGLPKEEFEELKAQLEEEELKVRRRAVGTVRFIGELFKHGQLTTKIMNTCISLLIEKDDRDYDEETLECLCKLLTTIGSKMEQDSKQDLGTYFDKMLEIVKNRDQYRISSRIRFMIQDVIDLRRNGWQPRRQELNPKTMNQIVKEAETEQLQISMNYIPRGKDSGYSSDMGRGNRGNMQGGGSKMSGSMGSGYNQGTLGRGGNQGSMKGGRLQTDDDGFQQISNNRNNRAPPIDPKKINFPVSLDVTTKLGSAASYQGWKNNSNMFAALNNEDSNQGGSGGGMMDRDGDRDRDRSGSHRDRDRNQRDRDRSGSHNKNSGSRDSYHHKGSMERDRYNRYGGSSSQNDDRMSRSSREPSSSGGMRPMSSQHSNSQMLDRDRDRNMGKMSSQQPLPGRSSQQRHIPQSASGRMGPPSTDGMALSRSSSEQLYQQQQQPQPQPPPQLSLPVPKDAARRSFEEPDNAAMETLQKFSKMVNLEMDDSDAGHCVETMEQTIKREHYHAAIYQLFSDNIERDAKSRESVVRVIALMFEKGVITKADYLHALEEIFKIAEDLIFDLPQLYKYVATFYVLLLHKQYINLADIQNVSQVVINRYGAVLLKELLLQYESLYGRDATVLLWYDDSSPKFNDFIKLGSNEKLENFLNDAKLGYLLDSRELNMQTVGAQIKHFLEGDAKFVDIFSWIAQYVGREQESSNDFIRTLTRAVIEHCIDSKKRLNLAEFQRRHQLLAKYIDNKPERELQAMFAIQRIVVELEHPQNLLTAILEQLFDHDVIMEGIRLWKESTDPHEAAGKGVCLKGITQFMTMYMESLSDEDNTAEDVFF